MKEIVINVAKEVPVYDYLQEEKTNSMMNRTNTRTSKNKERSGNYI